MGVIETCGGGVGEVIVGADFFFVEPGLEVVGFKEGSQFADDGFVGGGVGEEDLHGPFWQLVCHGLGG